MNKISSKDNYDAKKTERNEKLFNYLFLASALISVLSVIAIVVFVFGRGLEPFFGEDAYSFADFITGLRWEPGKDTYGILYMIIGSLLATLGAIVLGVPVGLLTAVYISELASEKVVAILQPAIELLAGIPSVIFGTFGLGLIVPAIMKISPTGQGQSLLAVILVLSIMILPTIITLTVSSLKAVPKSYKKEASYGLGASKIQTIFKCIIPAARSGILAAIVLGIGRAIGETMAVMMVAGNNIGGLPTSIFDKIRPLTTNIALEMSYASGLHQDMLFATGCILFIFIIAINSALIKLTSSIANEGNKVKVDRYFGGKRFMISNNNNRKVKDGILSAIIQLGASITVGVLVIILAFVFVRGLPGINLQFLTRMWDDVSQIVTIDKELSSEENTDVNYIPSLGISLEMSEDGRVIISEVDRDSPVKKATNVKDETYGLKESDIIEKAGDTNFRDISLEEAVEVIESEESAIEMKVRRPGGGIFPTIVSTIIIILITLIIAIPIGIGAAIYLNEYARPGKVLNLIRFAIQNLAGIPSIIYGLFGMLLFVQTLGLGYSVLSRFTNIKYYATSPTIISTTEETLKSVPISYRHGSYGLGATKFQTISKIVLPSALPGILVAVILSIGRIVGESAALIWTAGTVAQIPKALVGNGASAATLTTKMYWLIKEASDIETATSIAVVLILLVILLNLLSKHITNKFLHKDAKSQED